MRVLLITMYFPPAGGGGVARPLKLATHLPELGIETHVLAPDDPKWVHRDDELEIPPAAHVHRARYLGPRGRLPAEELHGARGRGSAAAAGALFYRGACSSRTSSSAGRRPRSRRRCASSGAKGSTSSSRPRRPMSVNLIGAAVKRATGVPWVADLRDSIAANPDRRVDRRRRPREGTRPGARRPASSPSRRTRSSPSPRRSREEMPATRRGEGRDDPERLRLRRLRGARVPPRRALPDHAHRELLRPPRPPPVPDCARGDACATSSPGSSAASGSADREFAEALGLGDRLEVLPHVPRRAALELQRDSEALLLLLPRPAGAGARFPSGKIFEYLAAERPILAAVPAGRRRRGARSARGRGCRRRARRRRRL